jgi:hypothetical protein
MFDELRRAWREAVENFRRELNEDGVPTSGRLAAMRRDLSRAHEYVRRLEIELSSTHAELARSRDEEASCRRREEAALRIGDAETARLAAEFGARHARRSAVLVRKVEVLEAERVLHIEETTLMAGTLTELEQMLSAGTQDAPSALHDEEAIRREAAFRDLEREARERAAEARLEELKRRMR